MIIIVSSIMKNYNFFTKLFRVIFTSIYIMLIFHASKQRCCRHWKTWWNMFAYFCCRWIFKIIFPFINFLWYALKICVMNGTFLDFWYWLNSNILVSSQGIIILRKSLFSHNLLCNWKLFLVAKEWKQFRQWKSPWWDKKPYPHPPPPPSPAR